MPSLLTFVEKNDQYRLLGNGLAGGGIVGFNSVPSVVLASHTIAVKDSAGAAALAVAGDYLRLKAWNGSAFADDWVQVLGPSTTPAGIAPDSSPVGYTNYNYNLEHGSPASFQAGTAVVKYKVGPAGAVLLDSDNANGPYLQVVNWATVPWTQIEQVRLGNLRNFSAVAASGYVNTNVYGLAVGQYAAASGKAWLTLDPTNGLRLGMSDVIRVTLDSTNGLVFKDSAGATKLQLDMAGNAVFSGNLSAAGGTFAGALSAATGTFAGSLSAATGTFAGSLSAATGTFAGSLSAASGTFAGSLTAGSGAITGDLAIGIGGIFRGGATLVLTGNGYWLDYNSGTPRFRVGTVSGGTTLVKGLYWDGSNLQVKGTNFTLDASGNLTATNATLTGTVTATAGAIGGWAIGATTLSAGAVSLDSSSGVQLEDVTLGYSAGSSIKFHSAGVGAVTGDIWGEVVIAIPRALLHITNAAPSGYESLLDISATGPSNHPVELLLSAFSAGSASSPSIALVSENSGTINTITLTTTKVIIATGGTLFVGSNQVVGARKTGWGTPTGTLFRTALTNASTQTQFNQSIMALIADLIGHGIIGA